MPRPLPLLLLGLLAGGLVLLDRSRVTQAAEGEEITWGATNPTWSPGGDELAFSLFGSIWRVSAEGGVARQVTAAPGYDAHPAWSPDGRSIALVRGGSPGGPWGRIGGRLVVVDADTGAVRFQVNETRTGGTPSWSPDSKTVAIGMRPVRGNSVLYAVDAASGKARALEGALQGNTPTMTFRRSRRATGRWMETAWAADGKTIVYAGNRQGAPQL